MSTTVNYEGTQYSVPAYLDTGWAQGAGNLQSLIIALANNVLQRSGGAFTLTGNINFGASFGITFGAGNGITFTTPDVLKTFLLYIDNNGNITRQQLTGPDVT